MSDQIQKSCPTFSGLGGKLWPIGRYVSDNRNWSACNPSIAYSPELGYAMTVRSSNYEIAEDRWAFKVLEGTEIQSKVWFCNLDNGLVPRNMRQVRFSEDGPPISRGIEDAKLFWRDGSWFFTGVMLEKEHTPKARMALYKYDHVANLATFIKKWDGPDASIYEKNWMLPYEQNPNFDFIYGPAAKIVGDTLVSRLNTNEEIGGLRGNTNLWKLEDNTYIAVVHSVFDRYTKIDDTQMLKDRAYLHRLARYSYEGDIIGLSREFVFRSLGVEFACGLVVKDGNLVISWGERDARSFLATIDLETALKMIQPVERM
jgi:hypothetical protein